MSLDTKSAPRAMNAGATADTGRGGDVGSLNTVKATEASASGERAVTYDVLVKAVADAYAADYEAAFALENAQLRREDTKRALDDAYGDLGDFTGRRVRAEAGCDHSELSPGRVHARYIARNTARYAAER